MVVPEVPGRKVLEMVRKLPPRERLEVLIQIASDSEVRRASRQEKAEKVARRLCTERGLDFDAMDDEQKIAFIDDLIHEDRGCL